MIKVNYILSCSLKLCHFYNSHLQAFQNINIHGKPKMVEVIVWKLPNCNLWKDVITTVKLFEVTIIGRKKRNVTENYESKNIPFYKWKTFKKETIGEIKLN